MLAVEIRIHMYGTFMLLEPFWHVTGQNALTPAVFIHVCRTG